MADRKVVKWPSWRYGPNGEAKIFNHKEEVPKGWKDTPAAFEKKAEPKAKPKG